MKKAKRRTPERIVETALRLFNEFGEPNVTTTVIADEMNISPGNLYYHYRNKDEIVNALFAEYEREIDALLTLRDTAPREAEDIWFFLHLLFEIIWKYRFLYRDINDLLTRNRRVETHFQRILAHKQQTAVALCNGLAASGVLDATPDEVAALAVNITLVTTFWLSFEHARQPRKPPDIGRGIYQVMSLAAPWLRGPARQLLQQLSQAYI
ncbi:TetR/AcrR family transcriptional regulator [Ottowia sp.]|uniref:TetR/AcrR family transcriptional regulator n=1 Tax=Ottowia sp. TaxID=1898956 RepID=UPI002B819C78|nr:TetR/AcrR family transcriptional regulator [Ottowia sp.]HRN75724.1 TetR/AcrR family transcriptional regulator [Ottowia sp.]HRQ03413.1 TetR/AcrR family transcriptional regulator [Ottowia sp.]